jgi:hypothetical protein
MVACSASKSSIGATVATFFALGFQPSGAACPRISRDIAQSAFIKGE